MFVLPFKLYVQFEVALMLSYTAKPLLQPAFTFKSEKWPFK